MKWLSPFKHYKLEDFDSVYVPLNHAVRRPSVLAENNRKASTNTLVDSGAAENGSVKSIKEKKASLDSAGNSSDDDVTDVIHAVTLDTLRVEIEADIAASGHDSAYDRKSQVVNKAIQDIGMGSYQWQLFTLCGFGWFADNLCK